MTEEAGSTLGTMILKNGLVLGEMHEPSTPGATADVKETNAQNNIGGVKTKLVTWIDHDNLAFKIYYTGSTAQDTLLADIYDRDMDAWTVVMPPDFHGGGHGFSFVGQIAKCKLVADGEGPAVIEMEVTVNGRLTRTSTWAGGLTTTTFTLLDNDSNALTPVPAATPLVYEYDVEAYLDDTSMTLTPTAAAGTIYVNGTVVATGVASGAITLNTGQGSITYVSIVVTELNKTPKIYWLRVHIGPTNHP